MALMAGGSKNNTKKRKLLNSPDIQPSSKIPRKISDTQLEQETTIDNNQWRNLDLVLSLQSKEITPHMKVELAFTFVKSRANEEENGKEQEYNTLSSPRLIMYLSNWIQSLLISSEKKNRARDKKSEELMFCVDNRCWEIFQFCLDESSRRQVPLSLSRDLLRVICSVAKSALLLVDSLHSNIEKPHFSTMDCQLFSVNNCLKLLFSSHSRLLNGNLDLWSVAVGSVLEVLIKTFMRDPQDRNVGNLIIEYSCLVLEPFSKFLKLHPCRKTGFRDFVDKLLEPLLHLLGLLPEKIQDSGHVMVEFLFKLILEIMSYGLFHNVHLDEYFCLQGSEKYSFSGDEKMEITKTLVRSYLRHLFDKVDTFVSERKEHALSGLGEMLHLFVNCVKKFKKDVQDPEGSRFVGGHSTKNPLNIGNLTTEKSYHSPNSGWNTRKSFFDFFVLTTEPLLLDLKKQLQTEFESGSSLKDVYYSLNSLNKILYTVLHERVYVRTEDNSGGACLRFFKISYGLMLSCCAKFSQLWKSKWDEDSFKRVQIFHSVAKEFVLVVRNFLEIEYQVIGDDLSSIWLMILTFVAASYSSDNESELCPLSLVTVDLGCQVVNLFSELRQVNLAVLALCRALKLSSCAQGDDEMPAFFTPHGNFVVSGRLLLCSHRFRLAICDAIKSIPEGQANKYVETLTAEISDSLEWMKCAYSMTEGCELGDSKSQQKFSSQVDILGIVLSQIYSLILDSLPVTTGISYRIGVLLQNLIGVLCPSMTHLVTPEQGGAERFIYSVLGITAGSKIMDCKNDWQHKALLVLLFFFRLYVTCINLYRQTLSLMPPNSKKKMSGFMTDLCTAYSGDDLLEMADFVDEGYFSWNIHSSSLLSTLTQNQVLQQTNSDCLYGLDSLKSRLRMSFKVLIQKPSEPHLSCIMQGLERAVVGRQGSFTTVYDVKRESSDGGVVSSVVAVCVDCMDLLLEFLKDGDRKVVAPADIVEQLGLGHKLERWQPNVGCVAVIITDVLKEIIPSLVISDTVTVEMTSLNVMISIKNMGFSRNLDLMDALEFAPKHAEASGISKADQVDVGEWHTVERKRSSKLKDSALPSTPRGKPQSSSSSKPQKKTNTPLPDFYLFVQTCWKSFYETVGYGIGAAGVSFVRRLGTPGITSIHGFWGQHSIPPSDEEIALSTTRVPSHILSMISNRPDYNELRSSWPPLGRPWAENTSEDECRRILAGFWEYERNKHSFGFPRWSGLSQYLTDTLAMFRTHNVSRHLQNFEHIADVADGFVAGRFDYIRAHLARGLGVDPLLETRRRRGKYYLLEVIVVTDRNLQPVDHVRLTGNRAQMSLSGSAPTFGLVWWALQP